MNRFNHIIRQFVIAWFMFFSLTPSKAQKTVQSWLEVNTYKQDVPSNAHRMPDGMVILSAIQFDSYYAKRNLLLVKMDEQGRPQNASTIDFGDTNIVSTAGVFKRANGGYLVFAIFTVDSPYLYAKKFGYFLVNDSLQLTQLQLLDLGLKPDTYIQWANMKYDVLGNEYYGLQMTANYTQEVVERYANLFIIDSLLNVKVSFPDSHAIYTYDTSIFFQDILNGDVQRLNDSLYSLVYSNYNFIGTTSRHYNRNVNKSFEIIDGGILLDTVPYRHGVNFLHPDITSRKWTDTTILLTGVVKQSIWPKSAADTLLDQDNRNGQAIIAEVDSRTFLGYNYKHHLFENWKFEEGSCFKDYYYSGITQNMDFIYPGHVYFISFCGHFSMTQDYGQTSMSITSLNERLEQRWKQVINGPSPADYAFEAPYSILATSDSGCLVFTRKAIRFYNEPSLGRSDFPEYDIGVYKLNTKGEYTAIPILSKLLQRQIRVYPNPVQEYLVFDGLPIASGYTVRLFDLTGKDYGQYDLDINAKIKVDHLSPRLYFYQVYSKEMTPHYTGKFIVK